MSETGNGCVPFMLAARTPSALSTLTALRTTPTPAFPMGSLPASVRKVDRFIPPISSKAQAGTDRRG